MNDERFTLTQDRLISVAATIRNIDLSGFIQRITTTQKAAPILDPEIYAELHDFEAIRAVAGAALEFKKRIEEIRKLWRQRRARAFLNGE